MEQKRIDMVDKISIRPKSDLEKGLILVFIIFIAYLPTLYGGFVWDDGNYIYGNHLLRNAQGLWKIWFHPTSIALESHYWPLVYTTYWLEYRVWNLVAFGYRLDNLILHIINTLLIWVILRRISVSYAWIAAAIFGLHPVHVESVSWIIERKDVLSGMFYLLAFLSYLQFEKNGNWKIYTLGLFSFVCAMLSKSIVVSLPVALFLYLWWKNDSLNKKQWVSLIPFFVIALIMALVDMKYAHHQNPAKFGLSFIERCIIAGHGIWFYVGKLVWPTDIMAVYPLWKINSHSLGQILFPGTLVLIIVILWLLRNRIGKGPLVAVVFFIATVGPTLGFIDFDYMVHSYVADRFQYLASIGLITLFVTCIGQILHPNQNILIAGTGVICILLGILTWRQTLTYKDTETLFRHNLALNPNSLAAHINLGNVFFDRGDYQDAKEQYYQVLKIRPDFAQAHNNLGNILEREGKLEQAIAELNLTLQLKPDYAEAYNNLGIVLELQGKMKEAVDDYNKALQLKPDYADPHNNLGNILAKQGKNQEAVEQYIEALNIEPNYPEVCNNLAIVLAKQGKLNEAITQYLEALRLRPNFAMVHNNLGIALSQEGRLDEAIAHFKKALEIQPDYADARKNLDSVLAAQKAAQHK
jgi:protein O-mannosyl-transferase